MAPNTPWAWIPHELGDDLPALANIGVSSNTMNQLPYII